MGGVVLVSFFFLADEDRRRNPLGSFSYTLEIPTGGSLTCHIFLLACLVIPGVVDIFGVSY